MNLSKNGFKNEMEEIPSLAPEKAIESKPEQNKGPLSFFTGSITSLTLGWLSLLISRKIIYYFMEHSPSYASPIAQSIASGFKTLIIGMSFLATFTFGFIGLGLFLVFIRSLIEVKTVKGG